MNRLYFICMFIGLLVGCSKTNNLYNRITNPIATQYNILYNGEIALNKGKQTLSDKYREDYFEILPIEPLAFEQDIKLKGEGNADFDTAEDKAIKAIQKHSITQNGLQYNYKMGDAYMLLGKARYYNGRLIPALEAFEHLLTNFGQTKWINWAGIWHEKTNIRLDRAQLAIENLNKIIRENKLTTEQEVFARETLSQAYINEKQYKNAVNELVIASEKQKNKNLKGRYYFIIGQLFDKLNLSDEAYFYYSKVVALNRNIDRQLWIQAQMKRIANAPISEKQQVLKTIKKWQSRYEHKSYLDILYYYNAVLLKENPEKAIALYKKSLQYNAENKKLRQKIHQDLADLSFKQKKYLQAYAHYDSTLVYIPKNTLDHLYIRRKRDNLQQIADNEQIVNNADSLLHILNMSDNEKVIYFEKFLIDQKKISEKLKSEQDYEKNSAKITAELFYFYNPKMIEKGRKLFFERYGQIPLQDNWRWAKFQNKNITEEVQEHKIIETEDVKKQIREIISQLPDKSNIESLKEQRNKSLYILGGLYFEKFSDSQIAISRLERLLALYPSEQLRIQTLYMLFKIYEVEDLNKAQKIRQQLEQDYPNSDYTKVLQGNLKVDKQDLERLLSQWDIDFKNQNFDKILSESQANEIRFQTSEQAPQWALIRAKVIGRLYGIISYREQIRQILQKFPNFEPALQIEKYLSNNSKVPEFEKDNQSKKWKLIILSNKSNTLESVQKWLKDCLKNHLSASIQVYDTSQKWIVIDGFSSKIQAKAVEEEISVEKQLEHVKIIGVISTRNYEIIQMYKNKSEYFK